MQTRKVHVIASGSSGNCTFVRLGETRVLVDVGISVKRIRAALAAIGEGLESVSAVIVTHEHTDHVRELEALLCALPELVPHAEPNQRRNLEWGAPTVDPVVMMKQGGGRVRKS